MIRTSIALLITCFSFMAVANTIEPQSNPLEIAADATPERSNYSIKDGPLTFYSFVNGRLEVFNEKDQSVKVVQPGVLNEHTSFIIGKLFIDRSLNRIMIVDDLPGKNGSGTLGVSVYQYEPATGNTERIPIRLTKVQKEDSNVIGFVLKYIAYKPTQKIPGYLILETSGKAGNVPFTRVQVIQMTEDGMKTVKTFRYEKIDYTTKAKLTMENGKPAIRLDFYSNGYLKFVELVPYPL